VEGTPVAATAGAFPTTPSSAVQGSGVKVDVTKDLWTNILLNVKEATATEAVDQTVLVVGAKGSGKSTVINRILGSTTKTKPTTALEYSFGKRDDRNVSQTAHFWELAQGSDLSQLADVVITPENVHSVVVVIVVDCNDMSTMMETALYWLKRTDRRTQEIFQKMRAKNSATPDKLLARAKRLIGEDHPDLSRMRLSGIPTVVVCNRLDVFKGDSTRLKLMARTMRYLAHLYGASIIFTSENSVEVSKLRALMNYYAFQVPLESRFVNSDPERGSVFLTPERDIFRDIGDPNSSNMADFKSTGDADVDRWKAAFDEVFPPKKVVDTKLTDDPFLKKLYDANDGFGESAIDSMRRQKDEELEQYRRNSSKKSDKKDKDEKDS